jgi:hypothetical protein
LVDGGLQRASNGRLRLAQAQGTIWYGAGQFEIRDVGGRNAIARDVSWRVLPESLLRMISVQRDEGSFELQLN